MCCKGFEPERDEPVKKTCRWHVFRARGRSGYAARPADAQAAAKSLAAHHRNGIPVGMPFLFFGKKSFLCAARDSNPKGTSP